MTMKQNKDLYRIIEECSEVQKVCCKMLRFGFHFRNPATDETNFNELRQECADLIEVISEMVDIDSEEFRMMRIKKAEKLARWKKREVT